jgi:hypothetical protein
MQALLAHLSLDMVGLRLEHDVAYIIDMTLLCVRVYALFL